MATAMPCTIPQAATYLTSEHVLVASNIVMPGKRWTTCPWCEFEPEQKAVLSWTWPRFECTSDGGTDTCLSRPCLNAAMEHALADSAPEDITVLYPVVAHREIALAA